MPTVTVRVDRGPKAVVPWEEGLTALKAMERAQAQIEPDPKEQFTFCLQYYGESLGYLVNMINETYDSFISRGGESATPFFYWNCLINGKDAPLSVDRQILNENEELLFRFVPYDDPAHKNTLLGAKHKFQSR